MSLNDKYAYIVLSFLTFLNSLAVSKYFRFLVIPKNKGIINKKNFISSKHMNKIIPKIIKCEKHLKILNFLKN